MCCGTKRLSEIACPPDCVYLASSRDHPPAVEVRRRQRDVDLLLRSLRDMSEVQSQLLLLTVTFLARYQADDLHQPIDQDAVDAIGALASTLETAVRGVIYDHRPASLPAERLLIGLKSVLGEARGNTGTRFDRDAALVLRRVEEAAAAVRAENADSNRAFFDWLKRVTRDAQMPGDKAAPAPPETSRLIVP